jgi:glycosyltransferase involved in cell wall biosynthesis
VSSEKTIGFITSSFPRYDRDIAGNFVLDMVRAFELQGYRIEVIVPQSDVSQLNSFNYGESKNIKIFKIPYVRPQKLQKLFFGAGVLDNINSSKWLISLIAPAMLSMGYAIRRRSPFWDAAISHWLLPSGLLCALFIKGGIPHMSIGHSGDINLLKRLPLKSVIADFIYKNTDYTGFVSARLKTEFAELIAEKNCGNSLTTKLVSAPMGVFPELLMTEQTKKQAKKYFAIKKFTALYLGRLIPIKGVNFLIEALVGNKEIDLIIAGEGPLKEQLKKQAAISGVNARFTGAVTSSERAKLFKACDVLVVPSIKLTSGRHEGLPLAISEALSAGLPVIATKTGSEDEAIQDKKTVLHIPEKSSSAILNAIKIIKNDQILKKELILNGKMAVKQKNWHFLIKMYESLLFN